MLDDLTVQFADGDRLDYPSSLPAGFILLDLEADWETERLVRAQRLVTGLRQPEGAPKTAVIRVRRIAG